MPPHAWLRRGAGAGGLLAGAAGLYLLTVTGRLTLDLGVGRRSRPLGPIERHIAAPRETVFDVVAGPYLGRTPRAMAGRLRVLERGGGMVLAEHVTPLPGGLRVVTLETVTFQRPERIGFRLVRGPVPCVVESYELSEVAGGGTDFVYRGELGTDLWAAGAAWGARVARSWERAVAHSIDALAAEAERRAAATRHPHTAS